MYASFHSLDGENRYEWARGIVLEKHPHIDKSKWGDEAKKGYTYKTSLNSLHCPNCHKTIFADEVVHEMGAKEWKNYCVHCRPDLSPALP